MLFSYRDSSKQANIGKNAIVIQTERQEKGIVLCSVVWGLPANPTLLRLFPLHGI